MHGYASQSPRGLPDCVRHNSGARNKVAEARKRAAMRYPAVRLRLLPTALVRHDRYRPSAGCEPRAGSMGAKGAPCGLLGITQ